MLNYLYYLLTLIAIVGPIYLVANRKRECHAAHIKKIEIYLCGKLNCSLFCLLPAITDTDNPKIHLYRRKFFVFFWYPGIWIDQ